MKTYKFKAHFNRVNMQRDNPRVWTVHFRGVCHQVEGIRFEAMEGAPITTLYNPAGRQPRATLNGYAKQVRIKEGIAVVK